MATATLSKEMLEAHPGPGQIDRDVLARCIDECFACEQSCTACADADLAEEDFAELRRCARLCLDCADVCGATGRMLTRQTDFDAASARAQVSSCITACELSAEECEHHADHHEHCRLCAEECRRCIDACSAVLDAIGEPS
jgi:hypothetical protein